MTLMDRNNEMRRALVKRQQLEIRFGNRKVCNCRRPVSPRRRRAQWWFQQMRVLVDNAMEWRPASQPRPEQTYLALFRSE